MLLAVTAVALWLGLHFYPAQRQRRAVEAIEALGGTVGYDFQVTGEIKVVRQKGGGATVTGLARDPRSKSRVPQWLRLLVGDDYFSTVTWVRLTGPKIGDNQLRQLARLPGLRCLDLSGTRVTGEGLKQLTGLTQLEELDLSSTSVSDEALDHLSRLHNLLRLNLQDTRATTAGMKHLAALHRLRALELGTTWRAGERVLLTLDPSYLHGPPPKHGGLLHLKQLKDLELLDVTWTRVTEAEIQELQKTLPNLVIRQPGEFLVQVQDSHGQWVELRQLKDAWRQQDAQEHLHRHDEGMLFDAWQRSRQWPGNGRPAAQ